MNSRTVCQRLLLAVFGFFFAIPLGAAPNPDYGKIEWIKDTWGIPHVFSDTDKGAMYGLGYATAEERGFQMTYNLRIIQGRLAETIGIRNRGARQETSLDNDRKMRTFGWTRGARVTAANLDSETLGLLEAYCQGVNDSFAAQTASGKLHPMFSRLEILPETWTAADCLLSWWHLAQFFATDGTRDLMSWRNLENPPGNRPQPPEQGPRWMDDSTAVVQRGDVSETWVRNTQAFYESTGGGDAGIGEPGPKFSHAWVVGGSKTTTGAAVLVSDPQTPVRNPSLWMEFHVSGKTMNARGVGIPGSPGLLIGFNQTVAWGLTALGADQADLFRLETDPAHPDEYRWDGSWRKMKLIRERIKVRGGKEEELLVRETLLGPIVSAFSFRRPGEPEVALKRIPMCETDRDTIQGVFAMMRAKTASEFEGALKDWRFPTANCVFGDSKGAIGYSVVGAIPVRSKMAKDRNGRIALPGTGLAWDWQGYVPSELLPHITNPKAGVLLSANHRPVGSFYKIPLGISTGSMGDTIRSWRLRERLVSKNQFSPEDVLNVHYDTTNPARREIVRIGVHLRNLETNLLSEDTLEALGVLEKWLGAGASSDLKAEGAGLATGISTFFRMMATPVALDYGGGESGLARFLKDAHARIAANAKAEFSPDEQRFIDGVIADAWQAQGRGRQAERTARGAVNAVRGQKLGWFDSLDGFGSLDVSADLPVPGITCFDGQTIHSQLAQSYTQWVRLDDVDASKTICPIGHSDRPESPYRTSTLNLWAEAELHAAPLSREGVGRIEAGRRMLSK